MVDDGGMIGTTQMIIFPHNSGQTLEEHDTGLLYYSK